MLTAGTLRELISVERLESVELPDGSSKAQWTTKLETYAHVRVEGADLDTMASQDNLYQVTTFRIRYRTDNVITSEDRIAWRGRYYKLHTIRPDVLRRFVDLITRVRAEEALT